MADTVTPKLGLTKPEIGASDNSWGGKVNTDFDLVDALFDTGPLLKVTKGGTGVGTSTGTGNVVLSASPTLTGTVAGANATLSGTLAVTGVATLGDALVGTATQAAFNTTTTTLNLGGAATAVNLGAATGTATVANTTLAAKAITASTTLAVTGASTLTGLVTATAGVTGPLTSSNATITGGSITGITDLAVADGGTGASTAADARTSLGLVIGTDVLAPNGSAASLTSFPTLNQNTTGNAATVTTNANLTGGVTSVGNAATVVTNANLTGGVTSVGNAATVVTNANLTGAVTSVGNATSLGSFSSANLLGALTDETGTGVAVFATNPVLVTPNLGTPSAAVLTSATGLPLTSGVTGLLPVANGGTATATPSLVQGSNITITGTWPNQTIAAVGSGLGDVVGPASSTDNAITRFDLTTGKLVQNSLVTVADDGAITAPQVGSVIPFYYANQAAFPSASTYHGALAHSHSDGAMYFAHGGVWTRLLDGAYTTTATAGGTTTLSVSSAAAQFFTGTSAQTIVLPVASTLVLGQTFSIHNNSTSDLTVNSSGSNLVATVTANTTCLITCILTSGTTAASFDADFTGFTSTLPVARGGTGTATPSIVAGTNVTVTGTWPNQTINSTASGTGDVVGPASSTDNAFARFDGTTGKLVQNSTGATLSDTGAAVFTGALDVLGNSTAGSNLKLYEDTDNGTNFVSLKAPNTIAADVTFTLPSADGTASQFLQTNGSGTLSFATVSGGGSSAAPTTEGIVYGKTDATSLTFLGYQAGVSTTGIRNTFIGFKAGFSNVSGTNNVMVGLAAGEATTGSDNTFVGSRGSGTGGGAGNAVTSGSRHTLIGQYDGNQDGLDIRTATNYAVISDGAGNRLISTANGQTLALDSAVPNSGTGITFPATQSASSDANTLDDYEEGTWTPAYAPTGGAFTTATYGRQYGFYQKIGNTVHLQMYVYLSSFSIGTGAGALVVTGAPFTPVGSSEYQSGAVSYTYNWQTNNPTKCALYQSDARIYLFRDAQGAALENSPDIVPANLKNGNPACVLSLAISYRVA